MTSHLSFALLISLCLGLAAATVQPIQRETKPEVVQASFPSYPAIARSGNASGTVAVTVEIDNQGNVAAARMTRGNLMLGAASLEAARKWKFKPTQNQGSVTVELLFDFVLSECKSDSAAIGPYHLRISSVGSLARFDTEDNVPKELEGTLCKVHHVPLQRDRVRIRYGLVGFQEAFLEAEKKLFPNANTEGFGGCVIETIVDRCTGERIQASPRYAAVLYCSACRRAQERWAKAHRRG